ncbi:hypothetical protein MYXA107069_20510 [Myxococcus xanthus]|nr:hypothetical protein MyxoNM_15665 [Myxococcus xanthus]SDX70748.1 hypothetical protein SAMN05444383_111142 [Myxococcus xanthus]
MASSGSLAGISQEQPRGRARPCFVVANPL